MEEFRDTVGDLSVPSYVYWQDNPSATSQYMIYYIWLIWNANVLFMLVIMLNLLISIMGQSYESATSDNFTMKYRFRVNMTCEAAVIK